jgi:hypothetical protein
MQNPLVHEKINKGWGMSLNSRKPHWHVQAKSSRWQKNKKGEQVSKV